MKIKKIEDLNSNELKQRRSVLYNLCGFGTPYISTAKENFMQRQWFKLTQLLQDRRRNE